jgi:ABC-type multidrug transport system permease subunit
MFDKALLLDKGGKMAFFGTPQAMLEYFWRVYHEETGQPDEANTMGNVTPDFVFDVLETPLRDIGGDIILEQNTEGHLVPARRFPPNFWRDHYQTYRMMQSMASPENVTGVRAREEPVSEHDLRPKKVPQPPRLRFREEAILFGTMLRRAFLSKLRNRANLLTTLLEAPMLALLISMVLRYSEEEHYTFATAFHIPTYLFMTLVVSMFLGLTNSADEIIRDRAMLNRERNHNLRTFYYLTGKVIALATFALLQCVIYLLIGNWMLELRDMFFVHLGWMFVTALSGACLGLLVSCIVHDSRTALNTIPLLLIPQIILGGALIKYEEMNKNLDLVYSIKRFMRSNEEENASKLKVPFICEFMPLRWSYEAMLISQAKLNPLTHSQDQLEERIQQIVEKPGDLTPKERTTLDLTKQALAVVSGLSAKDADDVPRQLAAVRNRALSGTLTSEMLAEVQKDRKGTTAEEIYVNKKVLDLLTKAEMERDDYRRKTSPNVFFGTLKNFGEVPWYSWSEGWHWEKFTVRTVWLNIVVMIVSLAVIGCIVQMLLKRQLTKV